MAKYKIAYVLTPITFGGSEKVSLNFLKHVNREKFDIEPIMFLRPWEEENVFATEISNLQFKSRSIPVTNSTSGEVFRVPRCLMELKEIIGSNNYDMVHTHGYLADLLGLPAARASGVLVVSTCHGFIDGGWKLSLYNRLDLMALGRFDRVIAVSDSISNDWLKKWVRPEKISVIENCIVAGANPALTVAAREKKRNGMGFAPDQVVLLFFGRLSREKGIVILLEALKMLGEQHLPVKLVLLGEGAQRGELEEIVRRDGLSEQVIFAGFQRHIEEWLMVADIFVLPSLTEGTPMALLEAMASGLPCIASSVGGIPRIIEPGVDGLLVPPGNPSRIRDAIDALIANADKREYLSRNARKKIETRFDIRQWTEKIENEYLRLVQS